MKRDWKKEAVVYQIYPKSFNDSNGDGIGDLQGIIEKIPYLQSLGVDAIWLSPVYESPMADQGYDISNYRAIHPDYGTMDDMKTLIKKLHDVGIKLIMDLVVNHTSKEHPWFIESKDPSSEKHAFYTWRKGRKNNTLPPNNWTAHFTGNAWTYDETVDMWYLHVFTPDQPDLNWENENVVEAVKDIIRFWGDLGVDGFRLDAINFLSKTKGLPNGRPRFMLRGLEHFANGPRLHEHLQTLTKDAFKPYGMFIVGETNFTTPEEALLYVREDREEFDMCIHFEHMLIDSYTNKWLIRKFQPKRLKRVLDHWQQVHYPDGWNALYFENHDQPRSLNRFGDAGEYREKSAKMLATYLFFQRGTPFIYQGQEIGMTNPQFDTIESYRDVETLNVYKKMRKTFKLSHEKAMNRIKYMSRDNSRTPMQWDDSKHAGFSSGHPWIDVNANYPEVNAKNQQNRSDSVFAFYQALIQLRKKYPVIVYGDYKPVAKDDPSLAAYTRSFEGETIFIIVNFSNKPKRMVYPHNLTASDVECLLDNRSKEAASNHETLEPYGARVYRLI